jgi:hypothetical protein
MSSSGLAGFGRGLFSAAVGFALKPTTGLLDLISGFTAVVRFIKLTPFSHSQAPRPGLWMGRSRSPFAPHVC